MDKEKHFENDLLMLGEQYWGKYLMNKFFIQIKTRKFRSDIPSYDFDNHTMSDTDQLKLQNDNYPAIYHEYIHYVHEVTTMVAMVGFYYQFVNRVYFSMYAVQTTGSQYPNIPTDVAKGIRKTNNILASLDGGKVTEIQNLKVLKINEIQLNDFFADLPNVEYPLKMKIPVISFDAYNIESQKFSIEELYLGKFYIYEGLAHNLDRLVQVFSGEKSEEKSKISSEYLVMEKIAEFLVPGITLQEILEIASLSLSYLNCGEYFVGFLNELVATENKRETLNELKKETSFLLSEKLPLIEEDMLELISILRERKPLKNAVTYLIDEMIKGTRLRIENPVFEVDIVYSKKFNEIAKYVTMCPMMYEFEDDFDTYVRDFTGVSFTSELGGDMLTLLSNLDYYSSAMAEKDVHVCPLYTTCNHPLRKAKGIQCKTKPRLAYEDKDEFGFCHYGLGVAYMKHIDEPQKNN